MKTDVIKLLPNKNTDAKYISAEVLLNKTGDMGALASINKITVHQQSTVSIPELTEQHAFLVLYANDRTIPAH